MSDTTAFSPPPAARVSGVAPRRKKASPVERVFASPRGGMALWDIARRFVRTVRRIVADSLERLEIDPRASFV